MCIIIDTNTLHLVFNRSESKHLEFKPVYNWIIYKNGVIVYGGSKYLTELSKTGKYLKLFVELGKCNKTYKADNSSVDQSETELKKNYSPRKFNDHHLAALVRVTKCRIICTKDKSAIPHLKNNILYPKGISKPMLYTKKSNEDLLNDKNISECCKPCLRMKKEFIDAFNSLLN